jgi:polar amino acid transport system ATP-binding protein
MTQLFDLKSIRKSFGSNLVLDDVSISFAPQSATVIIGASGSGKSTLMRCMNLLEEIDDGQILLENDDISAYGINRDEVRAQIGSVFQAFNLFPHLSVVENITLAPRLVHGASKSVAESQARQLLARFDLADKADAYPNLLSGGQQQRVAIIRAVATNPKLLLLDEVTSALDPVLIAEVLALIAELKNEGMTMVISTHEMGFAKRIADNVIFLHRGRVHESGTPAEIFDSPRTPELRAFLGALHDAGRL